MTGHFYCTNLQQNLFHDALMIAMKLSAGIRKISLVTRFLIPLNTVKGFFFPPDVYTNCKCDLGGHGDFERCAYAGSGIKQEEILVHAGRALHKPGTKLLKPLTEYRGNKLARTWNKIQVQAFNCYDSL